MSIYQSSKKLQRPHRILVLTQVLYVFLGLLIVPILVYYRSQGPRFGDFLANPRIFGGEGVESNFVKINFQVIFGLVVFLLYLVKSPKKLKGTSSNKELLFDSNKFKVNSIFVTATIVLGVLASFLDVYFFDFRPLTWLASTPMAIVGYYAIHMSREDLDRSSRIKYFIVILGTGSVLSMINSSKTPILFSVLILAISKNPVGFNDAGRSLFNKLKYFLAATPLVLLAIFAFLKIQDLKQTSDADLVDERIGRNYFGEFHQIYTILKRFDGLRSMTDANYANDQNWLVPSTFLNVLYNSIQWNYGTESANFGQLWNIHIVGRGFDGSGGGVASLSTHPIAEGYILFGYFGIALHVLVWCMLTKFISEFSDKGLFRKLFSLLILSSGSLFENGVIANFEQASNSIKLTLLLYLLFRSFSIEDTFQRGSGLIIRDKNRSL